MDFIGLNLTKKTSASRNHSHFFLFTIFLLAISLTYSSLPVLGGWLVREDFMQRADAIAVLSGRFPQRALEAIQLYRQGYANEIWLTHPAEKPGCDQSEEPRNFGLLRSFGVPADAIRVINVPIVNTADELNAIDFELKETGDSSVIVVTNKAHTRRVHSIWNKYHQGDGQVLVHAVSYDKFAPSDWWKRSSSRGQVIHELLGMLDVWAGMPVHPPLQSTASMAGSNAYETDAARPHSNPSDE